MKEIQQTLNKLEELLKENNELKKEYNKQKELPEEKQNKELIEKLYEQINNFIDYDTRKELILQLRVYGDYKNKFNLLYQHFLDELYSEFNTLENSYDKHNRDFTKQLNLLKQIIK